MTFLSEAGWLNARRLRDYPRIFLALYMLAIVMVLAVSADGIGPGNRPLGTDFMDVWSAGVMAQEGRPAEAYDFAKHFEVQEAALPWGDTDRADIPFYGWCYPPMFLLLAYVLAFLPYLAALLLWMISTLPLYLAAIRAIVPGQVAMVAALAYPGVFVTLGHGQNSFLTAALLGGGLVLLKSRPLMAGVLFGVLSYKPHFGLLLPLALLAGGHWRAIFSAGMTVLAVAGASWLAFGTDTWLAFFHSLEQTRTFILEQGPTGWQKIQSSFSAVRMLGGDIPLAYAVQIFVTVFCAFWIVRVWRSGLASELQYALLATGAILSTPYVLDYDLMVMALPIAWMASYGLREGFLKWEKMALVMVWILPLFARSLGMLTGLPVGPVALLVFLFVLLRRVSYEMDGKRGGSAMPMPAV